MDQCSPVAEISDGNVDGDTYMRNEKAGGFESLLVVTNERSGEENHNYVCKKASNVTFDDERGLRCDNEPPDKGYHSDVENSPCVEFIEVASPVSEAGTCTEAIQLIERAPRLVA
ncbi:unnamed protein product [Ilex paraguariensis]|uniref:Uncharacterized protein n=1 Tax=Ilex paraguariensis TaxID=185542 RepID=A0ABC8SYM9_9AQUA